MGTYFLESSVTMFQSKAFYDVPSLQLRGFLLGNLSLRRDMCKDAGPNTVYILKATYYPTAGD